MKKTEENRYPNSATLFRFCKEALEIRYEGNVKVIDQDVGAMLGYDPADCSHWKKGKKNIRALATLRSLADNLNIDERLLIDIASGNIGLEEAVFEYRGYGSFNLNGRPLETLKKEFFKNPTRWQPEGQPMRSFEEIFNVDRAATIRMAEEIIRMGSFTEAPMYLPEIIRCVPNVTLTSEENLAQPIIAEMTGEGTEATLNLRYRGPEMRPYIRFNLARELFKFLVRSGNPLAAPLGKMADEVMEIAANIFAGSLLVPASFLRKEVERIDSSKDIVLQLADTFWVSRSLMNQRLRDFMENMN